MTKLTKGFLIAVATLAFITAAIFGSLTKTVPSNTSEYAKTSVMITLENKRSGGSGVILKSTPVQTTILTNKHVCSLIQSGGVVSVDANTYPVNTYRVYTKHDLCVIDIMADLHVNTVLAEKSPELYSDITIAGHPALLPTIVSHGHFSSKMFINVMVGTEDCDGTEKDQEALMCLLMGAKPILRTFEAQPVSALIMPGSSGSGAFNSKGEIAGLVFAGPGEGLGYGFIVPYEYVRDFLANLDKYPAERPDKNRKERNFLNAIESMEKLCIGQHICQGIGYHEIINE